MKSPDLVENVHIKKVVATPVVQPTAYEYRKMLNRKNVNAIGVRKISRCR